MFKSTCVLTLLLVSLVNVSSSCDTIHCVGRVLEAIEMKRVFPDSKEFVDMATKRSPKLIEESFDKLPDDIDTADLKKWVEENFYEAGHEIDSIVPNDWKPNPSILKEIKDERVQEIAVAIHNRWKQLVRFYNSSRLDPASVSSHLPLHRPFVVPGGRFNEFYYWDSYWILQGLLISEMQQTAQDLLTNLLESIRIYGFIPNGSRRYYDNRSQPPLLATMMRLYEQRTHDSKFVRKNLHLLELEYGYWMREQSVKLNFTDFIKRETAAKVPSSYDSKFVLNLYYAVTLRPRPESFYEDVEQAQNMTEKEKIAFYSNVASVAESGWDFSSRWMNFTAVAKQLNDPEFLSLDEEEQQKQLLQQLIITDLVPFDLNGILYEYERTLQMYFCRWRHEQAEFETRCQWFGDQARRRFWGMRAFMYDNEIGLWSDYNMKRQTLHTKVQMPAKTCSDLNEPSIRLVKHSETGRPTTCGHDNETTERPVYVSDIGSLWYLSNSWRTSDVIDSLSPEKLKQENEIESEIKKINMRLVRYLINNINENTTSADPNLNSLQRLLLGNGGIAISNVFSGQQWDHPNAWAPYQQYITFGLLEAVDKHAIHENQVDDSDHDNGFTQEEVHATRSLAKRLTKNWLRANYCGWQAKQSFYEKYDVDRAGSAGHGGEYFVQEGFGWTNGVAMRLAEHYGQQQMIDQECPSL